MSENVKVFFETDCGDIIWKILPMDQDEIEDFVKTLGVNPESFDYMRNFDKLPLSRVTYEYSVDLLRNIQYATDLSNFIMFNFAIRAWEDIGSYDYYKIELYIEYLGKYLNPYEFINICMQVDDIEAYSYDYESDTPEEGLAKTLHGYEIQDWLWSYVDWYAMGENDADEYYLNEEYYMYSDCSEIDLTYYDFEDICDEYNFVLKDEDEYDDIKCLRVTECDLVNFLIKGGDGFVDARATC